MRLKKLRISGFKSFVDPTDIRLPADLIGVVGPNGCGKSNVIDAVRWVMGESSAKMLRGDSMADVIFNGSSSRKPVGKASVELIFDNGEGRAGGPYAQFSEISVTRNLARDGQSEYSINRSRTRRRDVLDLFRGTGLGPRSYSIIEQGMVSRIVESKPEELRVFVEEAAGISKYKDRRRETENRIKHTRENLERVGDVCGELDKQLNRLKRQASVAKRFKLLQQEKRTLSGQLSVLQLKQLQQQLESHDSITAQLENTLQHMIAKLRGSETKLEKVRHQQTELRDHSNSIQQECFAAGAEITNLEQRIEHIKETRKHQQSEVERLQIGRDEGYQQLQADSQRKQEFEQQLVQLHSEIKVCITSRQEVDENLLKAEAVMRHWQNQWDDFSQKTQIPAQQQEVQKSRLLQLQNQLEQIMARGERIKEEFETLHANLNQLDIDTLRQRVCAHDQKLEDCESAHQKCESELSQIRSQLSDLREKLADVRAQQHEASSRLHSLREIQAATLSGDNKNLQQWLHDHGWQDIAKLANQIKVTPGWERAVDRLLNGFLSALCVNQIDPELVGSIPDISVTLIKNGAIEKNIPQHKLRPLMDVIESEHIDLEPLLSGVYIADSIEQALRWQEKIGSGEKLVTRDGTLVGHNWISKTSLSQSETGVLVREEEIGMLEMSVQQLDKKRLNYKQTINLTELAMSECEKRLDQDRIHLSQMRVDKTSLHNRLGREESCCSQSQERIDQIKIEFDELAAQEAQNQADINSAQLLMQSSVEKTNSLTELKQNLLTERDLLQANVTKFQDEVRRQHEHFHQMDLKQQRLAAAIESLSENIVRLQKNYELSQDRLKELSISFSEAENPADNMHVALEQLLQKKIEVEKKLAEARNDLAALDECLIESSEKRSNFEKKVNVAHEELNQHKLLCQETIVHRDTLIEKIESDGYDQNILKINLPDQATIAVWREKTEQIETKISRIGPVNLVAIEEYQNEAKRKEYLDKQQTDLVEALQVLENVIRKIDKETKERFHQTFTQLNQNFSQYFPRLFGGGKAELLLTDNNLLITGVAVMAQPPGKRNSSIQLLSGGEKALTAVALLFALFLLNPAPFCMLDEVDAPLDDANVERYCKTLRSISNVSQLVVITHNKITMEYADLLVGVTMAEPGVSRLVSVNVNEAIKMAAQ